MVFILKGESMVKGNIHSIETFGSVDGPGVRYVLFLKGCRLRCAFCHNADTWDMTSEDQRSAEEIIRHALRYRSYWGNDGGITVSGGEPLLQMDFLIELFTLAKQNHIHTCIDTAGEPFENSPEWMEKFNTLMNLTDLLLVDIKHIDEKKHIRLTGKSNTNILEMFSYLDSIHKPIWVRQVLVPGWTDDREDLEKTREFLDSLHNIQRVEVLPYHSMGAYKWEKLGLQYPLKDTNPPSDESVKMAESILIK